MACGKHGVMLELMAQYAYDPSSPNRIYFSIGSAVTAIALVLAFNQLIRPITKFRLATGFFSLTIAYVLFIIAILLVFVAAILPFIPGKAPPLIGYPVFWEVVAGILFIFTAFIFLLRINRKAKFNKRNYKRYFDFCTSIIARGNERDLRELADEIFDSINEIIKSCKKFDSWDAHFARKDGMKYEISEYTRYALTLLDIWSDEKFCQLIVCHVPGTAVKIFSQIGEQKLYDSGGYSLINQLIRQASSNRNSILYREEDFYGLGHLKTFTNVVFGNYDLVESHFRPLQAWSYWSDEKAQPWQIEKYAKVLNVSTQANITSGWGRGHPSALYCGFGALAGIAMSQSIKLDKLSDDDVYDSLALQNLNKIEFGLKETIKIIVKHENDIPIHEVNEESYDEFRDFSVYGAIASGIFKFYEGLSIVRSHDGAIRMMAVGLWLDVYPVSKSQESKAIIETQKRLNIHLFKKVEENLEHFWYPALTRLLINLIVLEVLEPDAEKRGEVLFKNRFFGLLRKHYEKAVSKDPEKAKDMLPKNVQYDGEKGQLIKTHSPGSMSILDLR